MNDLPPPVRRREIADADLDGVVDLLTRGFPARPRAYWERGLRRMAARQAVEGAPRFGFLLDDGRRPVGVVLLLSGVDGAGLPRCNLSSWTVDGAFRAQAPLLVASALKRRDVTYTNISPAPHTWPIIEAQGFRPYVEGQSLVAALLGRGGERARIVEAPEAWRDLPEAALLDDHARFGCASLVVDCAEGRRPLVLLPVRASSGRWPLPVMQVGFCRDVADVARFAGAIGRWMALRGIAGLLLDGDAPKGLPCLWRVPGRRKYFKGPHPPRVGDLSYTERVIFGP